MNLILTNETDARTARAGAAALMAFAASLEGLPCPIATLESTTEGAGKSFEVKWRAPIPDSESIPSVMNFQVTGVDLAAPVPASFVPGDAGAAASPIAPAASQAGVEKTTTSASTAPAPPSDAASESADQPLPAGAVDSTGLPWDARIHSTPPRSKEDGRWRKKRGVDDAVFIASVEAELRGATPATLSAPPPPVPAAPNVQPAAPAAPPPPIAVTAEAPAAPSPGAPAAPVTAPVAPTATAPAPTTVTPPPLATASAPAPVGFEQFMEWLGGKMSTGALPFPAVGEEITRSGFAGTLPDLSAPGNLAYLVQVWNNLKQTYGE